MGDKDDGRITIGAGIRDLSEGCGCAVAVLGIAVALLILNNNEAILEILREALR